MKILSIDIGGTSLKYSVVQDGKFLFEPKRKDTYRMKVDQLVETIFDTYKEVGQVDGVAMACPGAITKEGIVNNWTAFEGLSQGYPLKATLERKGISQPIWILNDVNAAAFGESRHGAGKGIANMAMVAIGSGIGGGIIANGKLIEGHHGFGGEFGSSFSVFDKKLGKYMSPQEYGGFHALARNYIAITGEDLKGEEIFEKFDNKEPAAIEVIEELYDAIIRTLWVICFTVNPEVIVLGGGLALRKQASDEIHTRFNKRMKDEGISNVDKFLNLKISTLGEISPIYGAYYYYMDMQEGTNNE